MPVKPLSVRLLGSSLWVLGGAWINRLSGILTTIILARLLLPVDFGIVAMAMLVLQFFEVFANTGGQVYLIRKESVDQEDINTSWALNLVLRLIIAIVLFTVSPLIGTLFDEPRLVLVMQLLSLVPVLNGLANPGIAILKKQFVFRPLFDLEVSSRVITLIVTLTLALWLKNYWAFIIGQIVNAVVVCLRSYQICNIRPKWSLSLWDQQWAFSKWMLLKAVVGYTRNYADNFLVSKLMGTHQVGVYNLSRETALLPSQLLTGPVNQVLFVGLSTVKDNPTDLADKIIKSLFVMLILLLPLAWGLSVLAEPAILLLLGDQWHTAVPLVKYFSFMLLSAAMGNFLAEVYTVMGRVKILFWFDLCTAIAMLIALTVLFRQDLAQFAALRTLLGYVVIIFSLTMLRSLSEVSLSRLSLLCLLPLFSSGLMALGLTAMMNLIVDSSALIKLLVLVPIGVAIYLVSTTALIVGLSQRSNECAFVRKTFLAPVYRWGMRNLGIKE